MTKRNGFTLIELMLVVAILGLLVSIALPRMDIILMRTNQAAAKSNLGNLRSTISIYYTDTQGNWPFANMPNGTPDVSLTAVLVPTYTSAILKPKLLDYSPTFNGFSGSYDKMVIEQMGYTPPRDTYIRQGVPLVVGDTDLIYNPFGYDNLTGLCYIANDNLDVSGSRFFGW